MKDCYENYKEFVNSIPEDTVFIKKDIEIFNRATNSIHDQVYVIYHIYSKSRALMDSSIEYMREKDTGIIRKIDTDRLRNELSQVLSKNIDRKTLAKSCVSQFGFMELVESYDRVIVKKGKIRHKDDSIKFFGYKKPMNFMFQMQSYKNGRR